MQKIIVAGLLTILAVALTEATVCKHDHECGGDECCYIQPEFLVASKKRQASLLPVQHTVHDTGVCEKYHQQNERCYGLEVANGHCGCAPGFSCSWVPDPTAPPTAATAGKRSMVYHPEPGAYKCTPILLVS